MIDFNTFTNIPLECGRLGQINCYKGFKKLPKVQLIAQSGHTASGAGELTTDAVLQNLKDRTYFSMAREFNIDYRSKMVKLDRFDAANFLSRFFVGNATQLVFLPLNIP